MSGRTELIVALDVDSPEEARRLVLTLGETVRWYKVGKQLFTRHGPRVVELLKDAGKQVFLDLKYHDIPNTVGQAVRSAADIGVDMTNVHALGGPAMLAAAAEAAEESRIKVVAVTVLTSMDPGQLAAVGIHADTETEVLRLARLTRQAGLAGVVCSAWEIEALRDACGETFSLVVPGIRPAGSVHDDQSRVMTPRQAARAGADYIVVGRPVTRAADPATAAVAIEEELENA